MIKMIEPMYIPEEQIYQEGLRLLNDTNSRQTLSIDLFSQEENTQQEIHQNDKAHSIDQQSTIKNFKFIQGEIFFEDPILNDLPDETNIQQYGDYPQDQSQQIISQNTLPFSSDSNSQSLETQRKRKVDRKNKNRKIDLERNIFPNLSKRTGKMIVKDCLKLTQRELAKRGLNMETFEHNYPQILTSKYSGIQFSSFFLNSEIGEGREKRNKYIKLFIHVFQKIIRKRYLVHELRYGRMDFIQLYIKVKNSFLMYFSDHMQLSQMRQ